MRLMPFHQGVANCLPDDVRDLSTTRWITLDGVSSALPDWNDLVYISRWQEIMTAIAARYDNDPRLWSIDCGGYGNWGEGHNYPYENMYPGPGGQTEGTEATLKQLIRIACDLFHHTWIYYNPYTFKSAGQYSTSGSAMLLNYAMSYSKKIALRTDAVGGGNVQWTTNDITAFAQSDAVARGIAPEDQPLGRWRIAPMSAEWPGTIRPGGTGDAGSFEEGRQQVIDWHICLMSNANFYDDNNGYASFSAVEKAAFDEAMRLAGYTYAITQVKVSFGSSSSTLQATWTNTTSAPTYDQWNVRYILKTLDGTIISDTPSTTFDLRKLLSNHDTFDDIVTFKKIQKGTYVLEVKVTDPSSYLAPMYLAHDSRTSDGSYRLGQIRSSLL